MRNLGFIFGAVAAVSMLGACGGAAATEAKDADTAAKASAGAAAYTVDAAKSTVEWKGSAIFGLKSHKGTIAIKDGELQAEGGNLNAGKVNIDMKTIKVTDLDGEYAQKLTGHLGSPDFFDVAKNETSSFEITKVEAKANGENTHEISGNLTLKGQTHNVTFPAKVAISGDNLTASGSVTINRLDWGVDYDKDKQNTEKSAAEKAFKETQKAAVDKNIELTINITAAKKA